MKKRNLISLLLLLVLVLDVALMPVKATGVLETVPMATEAPVEEATTSQSKKLAFGTVSIYNGCRTIEASVPLGTGERLLPTAQAVMLFETTTNTMIYSYNPDMKLAPGSLAKIVAGLVAIEQTDDLDEYVTVSSRNISRLPAGSLHIDLKEQEKVTVRDLLYALVLHNANDAAIALAEHISGNMQGFLVLMNDRVQQLGCTSTEFANVHGLDNAVQYTTARDMTKIMIEASKNETFREIFGTAKHTIPETNRTEKRPLTTTNYMIDESIVPQFYTNRVKYGLAHYADASGASIVCVAEDTKKKMNVVAVIIGAQRVFQKDGWRVESYGNFNEMLDLLEYGFNNFKVNRLIYDGQSLNQFSVIGGESEVVGQPHIDIDSVLPINCQMDNLEKRYTVVGGSLTAPVKKDDMIATVELWYRNSCVTEVQLFAMGDVKNADKTGVTIHNLETQSKAKSKATITIFGTVCAVILLGACGYIAFNVIRRKRMEARRRKRRASRRRSY